MKVYAPPGHLRVQLVLPQVLVAAETCGVHAEHVEWYGGTEVCEQVGTGDAAPARRLVHDDGGAR